MSSRLQNALVDVVVLTGLDEDTTLSLPRQPPSEGEFSVEERSVWENLFHQEYDPQLLAVINDNTAQYPVKEKHGIRQTITYPPNPSDEAPTDGLSDNNFDLELTAMKYKRTSRRSSAMPTSAYGLDNNFSKLHLNKPNRPTFAKNPKTLRMLSNPNALKEKQGFNISMETLLTLSALAYPNGMHILPGGTKVSDSLRSFVLTDVLGKRSYASALTFYKRFYFEKCSTVRENGSMSHLVQYKLQAFPHTDQVCFVPQVCLVVSQYSYSDSLQECLRILVSMKGDQLKGRGWIDALQRFAYQVCNMPVPPAHSIVLEFTLLDQPVFLYPAMHPSCNVCDVSLATILKTVSGELITRIIAALFTEQRVVVVSENLALAAMAMEAVMRLISPFEWTAAYVVLTSKMIDFIEAPGYFFMGCHGKYREQILEVEGLILADLDSGQVIVPDDLPQYATRLPDSAASGFCARISKLCLDYDQYCVGKVITSHQESWKRFQFTMNHAVLRASLDMMVSLFCHVLDHLHTKDQLFFDQEEFLKTCGEPEFYNLTLKTSMFSTFLKDRVSNKHDHWSLRAREKLNMSESRQRSLRHAPQRSYIHSEGVSLLKLPNFTNQARENFLFDCITSVDRFYRDFTKTQKSSQVDLSCKYMTGMFFLALGKVTEALDKFGELYRDDQAMFPEKIVASLITNPSFDTDILAQVNYSTLYLDLVSKHKNKLSMSLPGKIELEKLPVEDIKSLDEFSRYIDRLNLSSDRDMIARLYRAMTLNETLNITPESFQEFYECWKENEQQCQQVAQSSNWDSQKPSPLVKVSQHIRTSLGNGRVLLTQKTLSFQREGSNVIELIVNLESITHLEKGQTNSPFFPMPALNVYSTSHKTKPVVTLYLRGLVNFWKILINEQMNGRKLTVERKDDFVDRQSMQNCCLMDALFRCSDSTPYSGENVNVVLKHIIYFTKMKDLAHDLYTQKALVYRANPCQYDSDKFTVESLLYIPGENCGSQQNSDPMLWCGMGNGRIRIFNAKTWTLLPTYFEADKRIICLALAKNRVWVGSMDCHIYLVDYSNDHFLEYKKVKQHDDFVCSLSAVESDGTIYSASIDGHMQKWTAATAEVSMTLKLPDTMRGPVVRVKQIQAVSTTKFRGVWCMTDKELLLISDASACLIKFVYPDRESPATMSAFLFQKQVVWLATYQTFNANVSTHLLQWKPQGIEEILETGTIRSDGKKEEAIEKFPVEGRGISCLLLTNDKYLWVGTKGEQNQQNIMESRIHIMNTETTTWYNSYEAHGDTVRALCTDSDEKYAVSGAGSNEAKIAIWRTPASID